MCISNATAIFNNTKGYIGRTKNNTVVMAYQMEAQAIGEGLRAIILQIPAKKIVKIHDTTAYCNFLNEIATQSQEVHFDNIQGVVSKGKLRGSSKSIKPVIEKVGMYNVVTLESYKQFQFLTEIFPKDECPKVADELIDFYSRYYSDWKFVIATFDNKIPMSAQPFLVEFESQIDNGMTDENFNEVYVFPSLDNGDDNGFHSGVPQNKAIREDHFLCFPHEKGMVVKFSQNVPDNLISNKVGFYQLSEKSSNGDFIVFADGSKPMKMDFENLGTQSVVKLNENKSGCKTNAFTNW